MGIVVIWSREKKTVSSKDVLGDKRVHYLTLRRPEKPVRKPKSSENAGKTVLKAAPERILCP